MTEQRLPDAGDFPRYRRTDGPAATRAWGRRLAGLLHGGEIVLLYGTLGAGKTCLVQGVCDGLGVQEEVVSPTFTLVGTYTGRLRVHHLDFYRVEAHHDLTDLGLPDILDEVWDGQAVLLAEWPEPLLGQLGAGARYVELLGRAGPAPERRTWYVRGVPELPAAWLDVTEAVANRDRRSGTDPGR